MRGSGTNRIGAMNENLHCREIFVIQANIFHFAKKCLERKTAL
jgi:hypothetical protein